MKVLKTGEKCNWKDIKVGEVFAAKGCWEVLCKLGEFTAVLLAENTFSGWWVQGEIRTFYTWDIMLTDFYKLPIATQRLWKEE